MTTIRFHGADVTLDPTNPIHNLIAAEAADYAGTLRVLASAAEKAAREAGTVAAEAAVGAEGEAFNMLTAPHGSFADVQAYTTRAAVQRQSVARLMRAAGLI
jgi:hypothetical protein